jgi:hypothetical protein
MLADNPPQVCERYCDHGELPGSPRLVVLTGGPGAGKTAVLELIKKQLCEHIAILPEAASIVFGGGFWRMDSVSAKQAAQKAIMSVQKEVENLVLGEHKWSIGLCDRGMPDGLAYWPADEQSFWQAAGMNLQEAYDRYYSVIHLRTPTEDQGYNHQNPLRTESAQQAAIIDEKIYSIWSGHPRYHMVESTSEFLSKAQEAMKYIVHDLPECCALVKKEGVL